MSKGVLRSLTDGRVSGTGTLNLEAPYGSRVFGGCLISTDGTNAAVVVVRETNASGPQIFSISTISPGLFAAPINIKEGTSSIHYSVTGTGAEAQLYEWLKRS